jgi:hypothetical protein
MLSVCAKCESAAVLMYVQGHLRMQYSAAHTEDICVSRNVASSPERAQCNVKPLAM